MGTLETALRGQKPPAIAVTETGTIRSIGRSVVSIEGLPGARSDELLDFGNGVFGTVFNLEQHEVGAILLDESGGLSAGGEVRRTGQVVRVPVGEGLLGRVVDPLGRPLDEGGGIRPDGYRRIEAPAPAIMDRAPVAVPLQTGLKVIDALIPIGRGQRELILGDRQTGKTAIALDTIINQRASGVIAIYCAIGRQSSAVAQFIARLRDAGAMKNTVVMVAPGEAAPGLQYIAPYAATSIGEYFMQRGKDVLIVYDDLTSHARIYREISLLFRRPPAREAFPGDIFYIHSRLLERSTHLSGQQGGGSLTALPIVETDAQNIAAYIPTNLISITDGQIYLSPDLFEKGVLPAVDVGRSVSRVGGKAQLPAYRAVAGDLKLAYSQFEDLETFARFGTRLDEHTRAAIEHGRRIREILKQPQYEPLPVASQVAALLSAAAGIFDRLQLATVKCAAAAVQEAVQQTLPDVVAAIERGEPLKDEYRDRILACAREAVLSYQPSAFSHQPTAL
jgi:F-type H+-transporting ATPase subunit alpha